MTTRLPCWPATGPRSVGWRPGGEAIRPAELRGLLVAYGVDGPQRNTLLTLAEHGQDSDWWRSYSHDTDAYLDLLCLAGSGAAMWVYEAQFVSGLLQTEDYTRGIAAAALARASYEVREQFVRNRLAHQQVLIRSDDALGFSAILSEAALRQIVGSRAVMWGQFRHLVELSDRRPNVTLQVLPFCTGTLASGSGPFTIMSFPGPGHVSVVRLAGQTAGVYPGSFAPIRPRFEIYNAGRRDLGWNMRSKYRSPFS